MDTNWLQDLARTSPGDFEVSTDIDRELSELAEWAQLRESTSMELLHRLAWKIERFVQRFRRWDLAPYDLDDVRQEAYLVFLATLRRWQPQYVNGMPTGYLYYFLKVFPYWLASRVRCWRGRTRQPVVKMTPPAPPDDWTVSDLCRNFNSQESTLVELRLVRGLSLRHAADEMGIARRTAYRRWNRILELSREYMRKAG